MSPRRCTEDVLLAREGEVSSQHSSEQALLQAAMRQRASCCDFLGWEVVYNKRNELRPFSAVTKLSMAAAAGGTFSLK